MATLLNYVERIPPMYFHKYKAWYWVNWANTLLERLSGAGFLPPQLLTRGVIVRNDHWIDRPPMSRDVKEIRHPRNQEFTYRFAEENNRLRLMDARFPEPEILNVDEILDSGTGFVTVRKAGLAEDFLKGWLFVIAQGSAAGHTFIVGHNSAADEDGAATVFFLNPEDTIATMDINPTVPSQVQMSLYGEGNPPFASAGYFVPQKDYLILSYVAKYRPVLDLMDDLGLDGYENLVEAWLRWKVEEQVSAMTQECVYWAGRVEMELANLRAELFNRMNKPMGRTLTGFGRR